jgi:hypothetical protein
MGGVVEGVQAWFEKTRAISILAQRLERPRQCDKPVLPQGGSTEPVASLNSVPEVVLKLRT